MDFMFQSCRNLQSLSISDTWNLSNLTSLQSVFANCDELVSLDISGLNTSAAVSAGTLMGLLPTNVRDLWLGSHTYLATDENDSQAFGYGVSYEKWGEISPDGTRTPVEDMRARTSLSSGRNPKGHYRIASLVFTVDYNNGEENETTTLNTASSSNSWNIPWGTHAIPAGKIFKEWKLTTSDSDHVSINYNTLTWDVGANDPNAKLTAVWRNIDQPTSTASSYTRPRAQTRRTTRTRGPMS